PRPRARERTPSPTRRSSDLKQLWPLALEALHKYVHTTRRLWAKEGERALFVGRHGRRISHVAIGDALRRLARDAGIEQPITGYRSEEHTSELQSRENLVCRL